MLFQELILLLWSRSIWTSGSLMNWIVTVAVREHNLVYNLNTSWYIRRSCALNSGTEVSGHTIKIRSSIIH
jgi:hypothetical protein